MAQLMVQVGWSHVGVLMQEDVWASSFYSRFANEAQGMGINVIFKRFPYDANAEVVREALSQLSSASLGHYAPRIFLLLCYDEYLVSVAEAADDLGLLSEGYAWITSDVPSPEAVNALVGVDQSRFLRFREKLTGFNSFVLDVESTPGFGRFAEAWRRASPADCNASGLIQMTDADFERPPPMDAAFAYDASAAIALSLGHSPVRSEEDLNHALRSVAFEGASGRVRFIDGTGDRDSSDLQMALRTWRPEGFTSGQTGNDSLMESYIGARLVTPNDSRPVLQGLDTQPLPMWSGATTLVPIDGSAAARRVFVYGAVFISLGLVLLGMCAVCVHLYFLRKKRKIHRFRWQANGDVAHLPPMSSVRAKTKEKQMRYHIFLSHKWPTGQQQVATIRERLAALLPGCKSFLDVFDLEDVSNLETHVEETVVFVCFISRAYFASANCLREVRSAMALKKPLIIVYEPSEDHGGGSVQELLRNAPESIKVWLQKNNSFIRWSFKPDLQLLALTMIAEELMEHMTIYAKDISRKENSAKEVLSSAPVAAAAAAAAAVAAAASVTGTRASLFTPREAASDGATRQLLYEPSAITNHGFVLREDRRVRVYTSQFNRGAKAATYWLIHQANLTGQVHVTSRLAELNLSARLKAAQLQRVKESEAKAKGTSTRRGLLARRTSSLAAPGSARTLASPKSFKVRSLQEELKELSLVTSSGVATATECSSRHPSKPPSHGSLRDSPPWKTGPQGSFPLSTDNTPCPDAVPKMKGVLQKNTLKLANVTRAITQAKKRVNESSTLQAHLEVYAADPKAINAVIRLQRSWRTASAPPTGEEPAEQLFVLFLRKDMWGGTYGHGLAQLVHRVLSAGVKVALLHDVNDGPFRDVMEATPFELHQAGLFKVVATDVHGGRCGDVSAAHFAMGVLGAQKVPKNMTLARRTSSWRFSRKKRHPTTNPEGGRALALVAAFSRATSIAKRDGKSAHGSRHASPIKGEAKKSTPSRSRIGLRHSPSSPPFSRRSAEESGSWA